MQLTNDQYRTIACDIDFQELCDDFVRKHVYACAHRLVPALADAVEQQPQYYDDYIAVTEPEMRQVASDQYRYIIDRDERGEFSATLYAIDHDKTEREVFRILDADFAQHLIDEEFVDDIRDAEEIATHYTRSYDLPYPSYALDCGDDIEYQEYYPEIYQHWIVSNDLAHWLEQRGEAVCYDLFGLTIWGRQTLGQAIAIDSVIVDIVLWLRLYDDEIRAILARKGAAA